MRCFTMVLFVATTGMSASATDTLAPRRPVHDFGSGIATVVRDAWAYTTSPLRMDRDQALVLGGIVAVGGALFTFDEEIHEFMQRHEREPGFDEVRRLGTRYSKWGLMGPTSKYYVGTILIGYAADEPRLVRMGVEILQSQFLCGYVRRVVIGVAGRSRPHEGRGAYYFASAGGTSLPSGHATSIWSAVEVARLHADRWWVTVPLYTVAGAISAQRVFSDAHWASDVWFGAALGIASARFFHRRHEDSDGSGGRVVPTVAPNGMPALGITTAF